MKIKQEERDIQVPTMDMPAPTVIETSTLEPIVSQAIIESLMRQLSESITTSIGSMFEKVNQSMEYRFQNLNEKIHQLRARMDLYDLTSTAPHDAQGPSTSSINNISLEIKDVL